LNKSRKRLVSLVVAVVMVAALLIPMVGTASASCVYTMTSTSKVVPSTATSAASPSGTTVYNADAEGNLVVTFDVPTFESSSKFVYMSLPENPGGYELYFDQTTAQANLANELGSSTTTANVAAGFTITNNTTWNGNSTSFKGTNGNASTYNGASAANGGTGITCASLYANSASVDPTTSLISLNYSKVFPSGTTFPSNLTAVTLDIPVYIAVPTGVTGSLAITASAQSSSAFSGGTITIGTVGAPSVTLAAESAPALSSSGNIGTIDIKENANGSLATTDDSPALSLTLPAGFTWGPITPEFMWGDSTVYGALTTDKSQAAIQPPLTGYTTTANNGQELDFYNDGTGSNSGLFIKLNAAVNINPSTAQAGPINVTIGGEITSTVSMITVGNYGAYGATSTASSTVPTIIAGKAASSVGELQIQESAPGSLLAGRTITLTLPSNAMWAEVPSVDPVLSTNLGTLANLNGYSVANGWSAVGTSGNEIEATVAGGTTTNAADIFLKNIEVTPAVDFTPGPLTVTIGGTEGLTGTATLANVAAAVTAAAASTPSVSIGQASETLGDLTITEAAAGNIGATATYSYLNATIAGSNQEIALTQKTTSQSEIDIYTPAGVTFFATPTVTVASGNLQIGNVSTSTTSDNQGELVIPILNASTSASTIKIAAPQVTIDNTVPNGPIIFKVQGTAVDQTELPVTMPAGMTGTQLFPNDTTAVSVTVANLGTTTTTTATTAGTVVFTIGQASYTANGSAVTIDVAPYIKDSRTFLPLRAVAEALGVTDGNVMWDPATQKVTILKGSMVVQLTIGSTTMLLNGASITMDTAPEINSGRTCLPVAWVAKALGANITWDATAQTVTITAE
jgi:hypothetical protein